MTVFVLKLIAMSTMLIDHIGFGFLDDNYLARTVGREAFVVYAFLMAESYRRLKDKPDRLRAHIVKLLVLCAVSEIPFDVFFGGELFDFSEQNVITLLLLGFVTLIVQGKLRRKIGGHKTLATLGSAAVLVVGCAVSYLVRSDYMISGVFLIVAFYQYLLRAERWGLLTRLTALWGVAAVFVVLFLWAYSGPGDWTAIASLAGDAPFWIKGYFLTVIPLAFYNQKLGYNGKRFGRFYSAFYPLHLAALILVAVIAAR
ncbi:MAG: hypothetical protein IKX88_10585 [Thermoguttaceae bacterium]|nr:hypothetical protein [Thermoguttaceae bacterium]